MAQHGQTTPTPAASRPAATPTPGRCVEARRVARPHQARARAVPPTKPSRTAPLKLSFTVQVVGQAPKIDCSKASRSTARCRTARPTHQEVLDVLTPQAYRSPVMPFSAIAVWAAKKLWQKSKKQRCEEEIAEYKRLRHAGRRGLRRRAARSSVRSRDADPGAWRRLAAGDPRSRCRPPSERPRTRAVTTSTCSSPASAWWRPPPGARRRWRHALRRRAQPGRVRSLRSVAALGTVVHVVARSVAELGAEDGDAFRDPAGARAVRRTTSSSSTRAARQSRFCAAAAVRGITVNTVHGSERVDRCRRRSASARRSRAWKARRSCTRARSTACRTRRSARSPTSSSAAIAPRGGSTLAIRRAGDDGAEILDHA